MGVTKAKKRILVVDDDPQVLEIFTLLLRDAGYEVVEAEHALAAICAMVRAGADLVLADIGMPIMDGLSLIRELKSHADTRHVPVVVVTGRDSPASRAAAQKAGCSGYITKPINAAQFLSQIAGFLEAPQASQGTKP